MNSWLVMNILWMLGDLAGDRRPVSIARVFFALGIVLLALAAARDATRPERLASVFARFRRLRL
jgi:hypothetical protein